MRESSLLEELEQSLNHKKYIGKKTTPSEVNRMRNNLASGNKHQAVMKGISQRNPTALNNTLNYFEKEKELSKLFDEFKPDNNCIFSPTGIPKKFIELKEEIKEWTACQQLAKKNEVLQTHFIFSTKEKTTDLNAKKLVEVMKVVQASFALNGQNSMFTVHTDKKDRLHAHILVNKFNNRGEKKFINKAFLLTIKENYKNDLNSLFGDKYIILTKKESLTEKTIITDAEIKYLKKIKDIFGMDGIEYNQHLDFKIKFSKTEKEKSKYVIEKRKFKMAIYKPYGDYIKRVKKSIENLLLLKNKGFIKKKLRKILPQEQDTDKIIDFLYFRKQKLSIDERKFGNRNFKELKFINDFYTEVGKLKKTKFLLDGYNYIHSKIKNHQKVDKNPTDYKNNLFHLERLLMEKSFFKTQTKNIFELEKKIASFYKFNKTYSLINSSENFNNKKALAVLHLIKSIENPPLARQLEKDILKTDTKFYIDKKINKNNTFVR